jgi:fatty acid desaturase
MAKENTTACIICKKEGIAGTPVRDDAILQAIRGLKMRLGILRGFKLVVCDSDLEEYQKRRKKFEKMAVIHVTVAAILVVAFIFGPLLLGAFNIMGVFFSLILGIVFAGLSIFSYIPALEDANAEEVPTPGQIASRLMPKSFGKGKGGAKPAKKAAPAKKKPYRRKKRK